MKVLRIVADPDGSSRFVDEPVTFGPGLPGITYSEVRPAIGTLLRRFEPEFASSWHPAGMRELAVMLSGRAEYEVSTGERRELGPGDVLLLEDTTGVGHRSRNLGGERVMLVIALA
jgi:quercetin dioxygenase-like cupin family protein